VDVSIRRSRPADRVFVSDLSLRVFAEYSPSPVIRDGVTFVAESKRGPLGFVTLETDRDGRAIVLAIAVDPEAQGQGVGDRLMRAAERHARHSGARVLGLCTAEANVAALDLFHKCGLGIVRRLPRFYSRGQNACWLEKKIA